MDYEPKGYTTIEDVENYMLIDIDPSFTDQVEEWICNAERTIDLETGRDFSVADNTTTTRYFDGDLTNTINIDPVSNVTAVTMNGGAITSGNYTLLPLNSTVKTKIQLPYQVFYRGQGNIAITGKFGYPQVPADIRFAATVLVAGVINHSWSEDGEVQSMTVGRYSVTYKEGKELDDFMQVQNILDRNKKYTF